MTPPTARTPASPASMAMAKRQIIVRPPNDKEDRAGAGDEEQSRRTLLSGQNTPSTVAFFQMTSRLALFRIRSEK